MSSNSHQELTSGIYINNEKYNDWRIEQIHSSINDNIIINLELFDKKIINVSNINLRVIKV